MSARLATITVKLESGSTELPAGSTLAALVERLGHAPASIATAVDGRFVPRAERECETLQDGQTVLLFQPIVGG
ncbi:MAG TPA: sulfur carrier protein ThiS [Methylibium sp.]|nr:sulfur carrier protein ThiS [Methylibium sp.]